MTQKATTRIALLRIQKYKGAYTRVAARLGLSPSFVRRVGIGTKTSARVLAALIEDARMSEREINQEVRNSAA